MFISNGTNSIADQFESKNGKFTKSSIEKLKVMSELGLETSKLLDSEAELLT